MREQLSSFVDKLFAPSKWVFASRLDGFVCIMCADCSIFRKFVPILQNSEYMTISYISAAEAAAMINHGDVLGVGGFGPAGSPKYITPEIAKRARSEHEAGRPFRVDLITGASIGASCDGELAAADAIDRRLPFTVNPEIRKAFNEGRV